MVNWFDEYKLLLVDEREYYKNNIFNDEQRSLALDYDRFIASLKYVAQNPAILKNRINKKLNIAEEVALSFENEALYISCILYDMKLIDEDIMQLIQKIRELFVEIGQDTANDWSLNYMIHDIKWNSIRCIANKVLFKLNESLT